MGNYYGVFGSAFDFNHDGVEDPVELTIGLQMTAESRQEAIALAGSDDFYIGPDDTYEREEDDISRNSFENDIFRDDFSDDFGGFDSDF